MNLPLIQAVFLAWPLILIALTRLLGPGKAVLVGVIGGHVLLPVAEVTFAIGGLLIPIHRWNVIGLSLLLGPLIFDARTLLRARPGWIDLPMALYYLFPLIGLMSGKSGASVDLIDMMIGQGLVWVVPYVMGRIYFSDGKGPASVAVGLVVFGLIYVPICFYEEIVGPKNYLDVLIYGIPVVGGMVDRLGGWRPEGFLHDGLAVAAWMALTTVMAVWLWLGGWKPGRWPAWALALSLLVTSISCRGVYGYLLLGIGLPTAFLTRWLRTRIFLVALMIVPVLYMAVRTSGAWDGMDLVRWARFTSREGTVQWRIEAEDGLIQWVFSQDPVFGIGGPVDNSKLTRFPDGRWLILLWRGGLVGLTLTVVTFHLLPVALTLLRPRGRPDSRQAASPSWGLACWCLLHLFDTLHNSSFFLPTSLVAGSLIGFATRKSSDAFPGGGTGQAETTRLPTLPVSFIATVLILVLVEILGRWRNAPTSSTPPPFTIEAGKRDAPP